jgi:hypothetical protein
MIEMKAIQPTKPMMARGAVSYSPPVMPAMPTMPEMPRMSEPKIMFGAGDSGKSRWGFSGLINLLKRIFNFRLGQAHARVDEQIKADPIGTLRQAALDEAAAFETQQTRLKRVVGEHAVEAGKLPALVAREAKEKREALAAAAELKKLMETVAEADRADNVDFQATKEQALIEKREWDEWAGKLKDQTERVESLNVDAQDARTKMRQAKTNHDEKQRAIKDAERLHHKAVANEADEQRRRETDAILNEDEVALPGSTADLIQDIKVRAAASEVGEGGEGRAERSARLKAKHRIDQAAQATQADSELADLMGALEESKGGAKVQKAAGGTGGGTHPVDEDVKPGS